MSASVKKVISISFQMYEIQSQLKDFAWELVD